MWALFGFCCLPGLQRQLHMNMQDVIFHKFFESLKEAVLFVQRPGVDLCLGGKSVCVQLAFDGFNSYFSDFAAWPTPAFDSDHMVDGCCREGYILRERLCIGFGVGHIL